MLQNYAFSAKPPRKKQEICKLSANYPKINCKLLTINSKLPSPGGPSLHNMARALMPRQRYSVAVPNTGGRFSSSSLRGEDRDERWSLL